MDRQRDWQTNGNCRWTNGQTRQDGWVYRWMDKWRDLTNKKAAKEQKDRWMYGQTDRGR